MARVSEDPQVASFHHNAREYALARPGYPSEIFRLIADAAPSSNRVWDCACGNGQAARGLIAHFAHVDASDISEAQISHAPKLENVEFRTASSEHSPYPDGCFDAVCVAQAFHWFDHPAFFKECHRVLRSEGILAVWGYYRHSVDARISQVMEEHIVPLMSQRWSPRNELLWNNYADISFPYPELSFEKPEMKIRWNLDEYRSYILTWSPIRRMIEEQEGDEKKRRLETAMEQLEEAWTDEKGRKDPQMQKEVEFTLAFRMFRKP